MSSAAAEPQAPEPDDDDLGYDPADLIAIPAAEPEARDTTHDRVPFTLPDDDETVYIGERPPLSILIRVLAAMKDDGDEIAQAAAFDQFLDELLEPDSVELLRARLEDRTDPLDLDHPFVLAMFETLVGLWYEGPTRRAAGSRSSRSRTSGRSTARRRSSGKTR